MTRPQLFMQVEPNITGSVTMVTFQKVDLALVIARQKTLESEIRQVIADGEEDNVFICNEDGIWYDGVNKRKTGHIFASQQADRSSLEYTKKLDRFMTSPPKKRGGGILPSQSAITKSTNKMTRIPPLTPKPSQHQPMTLPNSSITDKFADIQL
jgi:hypothetical protein